MNQFTEVLKKRVGGSLSHVPVFQRLAMLQRNAQMLRGGDWLPSKMMEPSFEKLLVLLASSGVRFIVVGGIAVTLLETTVVSYLTARPSRDLILAAHQQITIEWWETRRRDFDLYTSQFVIQEASAGDGAMAQKRLEALEGIALLAANPEAFELARALVEKGPIPEKGKIDALHIAVATSHGMDYLLTWNCKHIANAEMQVGIGKFCRAAGFEPPVICTPEELLGI